jgi:anti-sigma B factor antagonist
VTVIGELDRAGVQALERAVNEALDQRPEIVVIDLSATAFIDSAGMGSLVRGHRRAVDRAVRLALIPAPDRVHRIFELCGLDDVLPFVSGR